MLAPNLRPSLGKGPNGKAGGSRPTYTPLRISALWSPCVNRALPDESGGMTPIKGRPAQEVLNQPPHAGEEPTGVLTHS